MRAFHGPPRTGRGAAADVLAASTVYCGRKLVDHVVDILLEVEVAVWTGKLLLCESPLVLLLYVISLPLV